MLGDDFEPFLAAYEQPRTYGLRVNTAKISCEEFGTDRALEVKKSHGFQNGYFTMRGCKAIPVCCFIEAGLYYLEGTKCRGPPLPVFRWSQGGMCWICVQLLEKSNCSWFRLKGERTSGCK